MKLNGKKYLHLWLEQPWLFWQSRLFLDLTSLYFSSAISLVKHIYHQYPRDWNWTNCIFGVLKQESELLHMYIPYWDSKAMPSRQKVQDNLQGRYWVLCINLPWRALSWTGLLLDLHLALWTTKRCPPLLRVNLYLHLTSVKVVQVGTLPTFDSSQG